MIPSEQRGYDDQMAGRIDADLFCGDRPDAICYRNGARAARRELMARNDPDKHKISFQPGTVTLSEEQKSTLFTELAKDLPPPPPGPSCGYVIDKENRADVGIDYIVETMTHVKQSGTPPAINPVIIGDPMPNLIGITRPATPNAFADPQPGKRRRKPKADAADSEQLGLL